MKCKIVLFLIILLSGCFEPCFSNVSNDDDVKPCAIIMNEVLADPSPALGLPNTEYIELYNRLNHEVNLKGWKLYVGSKFVEFPSFFLKENSYLVLSKNIEAFDDTRVPLLKLSLPIISNVSSQLILVDDSNQCIDWFPFNRASYTQSFKADGGWALERKSAHCLTNKNNWDWSESLSGGSPGQLNSIAQIECRDNGTHVSSFEIRGLNQINVQFTERIIIPEMQIFLQPLHYHTIIDPMRPNVLEINLDEPLDSVKSYHLYTHLLHDMNGIPVINHCIEFGVPRTPLPHELIINELMPDPSPDEMEYIELYNRTQHFLDLSSTRIGKRKEGIIQTVYPISSLPQIMRPGSYLLLCKILPDSVMYYDQIFQTDKLQLANDSGSFVILCENGLVVDDVNYASTMHSPWINVAKGIALERINPNAPGTDESNWTSAAEDSNFKTPGRKNSQSYNPISTGDKIQFSSTQISPNGDGDKDFLMITILSEQESLVSIWIYDVSGRCIRELGNNMLLGTHSQFKWDGTDQNHKRVNIGVYLVISRVYQHNGASFIDKKAVAIE